MKFDFSVPCDYSFLMHTVERLCDRYSTAERLTLGSSLFGREIPLLRIGSGRKKLLLVGAIHASEHITAGLLLRFASDYLGAAESGGTVYGLSTRYLTENRCLYVIPMLNPDGVEIALHGPDREHPMYDRLMGMCPGGEFSRWQANGRGVDLNHNFDAGFGAYKELERKVGITAGASRYSGEFPESEPESAAVANFLRVTDIRLLAAFHTQGEEVYYENDGYAPPMGRAVGAALSRMCSYRLARPEGGAAYGGLKDYFIRAFDRPGYTIECGKGENPLPQENLFPIYTRLRQMLFHLPILA